MPGTPKRSEERTGHPSKAVGATNSDGTQVLNPDDLARLPFEVELLVQPPEPDSEWHPAALRMYEAMLRDPARIWMGPVAWSIAWIMAENVSREMYPQAIGVVEGGIDPDTGERIPGHVAREIVPMKGTSINALMLWAKVNGVHEADRMALRKEVTLNNPARVEIDSDIVAADVLLIRPGYFSQPPKES